jgi:hypothetical protein
MLKIDSTNGQYLFTRYEEITLIESRLKKAAALSYVSSQSRSAVVYKNTSDYTSSCSPSKSTTKKRRERRKNGRNLSFLRFFVVDFHSD